MHDILAHTMQNMVAYLCRSFQLHGDLVPLPENRSLRLPNPRKAYNAETSTVCNVCWSMRVFSNTVYAMHAYDMTTKSEWNKNSISQHKTLIGLVIVMFLAKRDYVTFG